MDLILKVKRLHQDAVLPHIEHRGDAGFDLYSTQKIILKPGERTQVPTGIAFEIPTGYVGLVWDKSGLSHRHGLKTLGGVIDSGYRGEILIGIMNLSQDEYTIEQGHKVAQMIVQKREWVEVREVDELSITERGDGGFGSTGK